MAPIWREDSLRAFMSESAPRAAVAAESTISRARMAWVAISRIEPSSSVVMTATACELPAAPEVASAAFRASALTLAAPLLSVSDASRMASVCSPSSWTEAATAWLNSCT